jgi:hypothetical protein
MRRHHRGLGLSASRQGIGAARIMSALLNSECEGSFERPSGRVFYDFRAGALGAPAVMSRTIITVCFDLNR